MSKFQTLNPQAPKIRETNLGPTHQMKFELFAITTPQEISSKLLYAIDNARRGGEKETKKINNK
jgi:hypothetical protein